MCSLVLIKIFTSFFIFRAQMIWVLASSVVDEGRILGIGLNGDIREGFVRARANSHDRDGFDHLVAYSMACTLER